MRSESEELGKAEESLGIARKMLAGSPEDPTILPGVITRVREAMRLAVAAMLKSLRLPSDPDRLDKTVTVKITKRGNLNEDWVEFYYDLHAVEMRFVYGFDLKLTKKSMGATLNRTEFFIKEARRALEKPHEHDRVSVLEDVVSDGYSVKKGMTGTIVSVYNDGEAYGVEIPGLPDPPAVVTLRLEQVTRIGE